jgi:predicted site-specific integrase-resolvase
MKRTRDEWYFSNEALGSRERPVTTRQLANHLQVSARTLANWRKDGRIPYWRLTARALRYELSAVERALAKPNFEEE